MNLFLDDIRNPKDAVQYMHPRIGEEADLYGSLEWNVVRDFRQFVDWVEEYGLPELVSFDHDLADEHYEVVCACGSNEDFPEHFNEKTGLDCAKWLVGYHIKHGGEFPKVLVHSMNPYGSERIHSYIDQYVEQFINTN